MSDPTKPDPAAPDPAAPKPPAPDPQASAPAPRTAIERYPGTALMVFSTVMVIVIGVLLGIMWRPADSVIEGLPDSAYARGLITFLFALGTIIIAIMLTIHAISRRPGDDDKAFGHAKEILTVLVGILGTIIGFYFGQEVTGETAPADGLNLSAEVSAAEIEEGAIFSLSALAEGGKGPYTFEVAAPSGLIAAVDPRSSESGIFSQGFQAPRVEGDTELEMEVTVTDSDQESSTTAVEVRIKETDGG